MPTSRVRLGRGHALITSHPNWRPGDQPPTDKSDYLGWHAWAEVQHKAGLRQTQCVCSKWCYPQEMSDEVSEATLYADKAMTRPVKITSRICNACAERRKGG